MSDHPDIPIGIGPHEAHHPDLFIDYADVLRQAVDNERWKVLREVHKAVSGVPTQTEARNHWDRKDRTVTAYKTDLLAALDKIGGQS